MKFGLRTPSWSKTFGAYRSQWKRALMRLFFPGAYGKRGMGWLTNPRKAAYNWWYNRTSFSIDRLLGIKRGGGGFGFACFLLASIVCLPADMINSGVKASKIKKARKRRESTQGTTSKTNARTSNKKSTSPRSTASKSYATTPRNKRTTTVHADRTNPAVREKESKLNTVHSAAPNSVTPENITESVKLSSSPTDTSVSVNEVPTVTLPYINDPATKPVERVAAPVESSEGMPKSKPKYDNDQYIRKRMIIAGSSYCDRATLDKLYVGAYIELVWEPDNAYDKDAIMLTFEGVKIGYIAKADKAAYVTCIKLGRSVYGVITDIKTDVFPVQYEYETWFNSK